MKMRVSASSVFFLLAVVVGIYAIWQFGENRELRNRLVSIKGGTLGEGVDALGARKKSGRFRERTSAKELLDSSTLHEEERDTTFYLEVIDRISSYSSKELQVLLFDLEQEAFERGELEQEGYRSLVGFLERISGKLDPEAAFLSFSGEDRPVGLFRLWAHGDPIAAKRWLESSGLEDKKREQFEEVLRLGLMGNGLVSELAESETPLPVVVFATSDLSHIEAAIVDPDFSRCRESLIESLMLTSVLDGVGEARRRAEVLGLTYEDLASSFHKLASEGGMASPEMLNWILEAVPASSEDRMSFLGNVMGNFVRRGFEEAGEWLKNAEVSDEDRDVFVEVYAYTLPMADPPGAVEWVATMNDLEAKERARLQLYRQWREDDPKAAEEWYDRYRKKE